MEQPFFEISGNIVDVVNRRIFQGTVVVRDGVVEAIRHEEVSQQQYIMPGFIDAHIHIESSMLIPSEFARLAVMHGTVATVSDPHEIANVLGVEGVKFMIENGRKVPFRFNFGAPSCVPATTFETAGAVLGVAEIDGLLKMPEIRYLSEMMNFPGVLFNDPEVMAKLELARKAGKPVDGHAPGLAGKDLATYVGAGISTDHECFTIEEARAKISLGMHVLIREGSAAKNFETLYPLLDESPDLVMLCSDDKHPNDLIEGHINQEVRRAIQRGCDLMNVLRSCTFNPVVHYKLDVGLLQKGDPADFIVVENLSDFKVIETRVGGQQVFANGTSKIASVSETKPNNFNIGPVTVDQLRVEPAGSRIRVMQALDGQLITPQESVRPKVEGNNVVSDPEHDILKIVVVNRYQQAPVAVGFISNFGLKRGALASSVAHDSHNIVAVGADDTAIATAINLIIGSRGGIALADGDTAKVLPLPVAGIMSADDAFGVALKYDELHKHALQLGSSLNAPFMTLSFMALLVIPELKLSDKGLFDGTKFSFTTLFEA